MEYKNDDTGVLFQNDKKGNDKAPDYKGKIYFGDEEKQLAGWKRESKSGKVFLSLKVSEPYKKRESQDNYQGYQEEPAF